MSERGWAGLIWLSLLAAGPALAQKVVVLEFEGDRQEKLRSQVEDALIEAAVLKVVPVSSYRDAAARKKLKGASAMTSAAVAKVSRELNLTVAVEGALGDTFFVRILDHAGQELWSKDLPHKSGLISPDHAKKLAKAVAAAAQTAPGPGADSGGDGVVSVEADTPIIKAEPRKELANTLPEIDLTGGSTASTGSGANVEPSDGDRDSDLDSEGRRTRAKVGPKLVTVSVAGSTTWRSYCSRPGVATCQEYDARDPLTRPKGDTVKFSPEVPYAGFALSVDFYPLATLGGFASGLGISGGYGRGWSLTNVLVQTPSGETPEKQVVSVDDTIGAALVYRYFFSLGYSFVDRREPVVGYAGLRGGYSFRNFEVDPAALAPLPGSHRAYPDVGLDVSVPLLANWIKVEASGSYFMNPRAGPDEIIGYGNPVAFEGGALGTGFSFAAGLAGSLYGPLGYAVRFKHVSYVDQFFGEGQKWPCNDQQCGGAAEESYSGLTWGLTASF